MIDTYNQFPEAYQIAVFGMRLFKQQNISYVMDGHCRFAIKKLQTRVMYLQQIYPGKLCQPTIMKAAISSKGPRLSRIFITHGKAIGKIAWQTPALL
jgi:hypothetical protein